MQKTKTQVETARPVVAEPPAKPWQAQVGDLLAQAAFLCVEHGLDVDPFMQSAWSAYIQARPGLREHLEEMRLRDQLEDLRKHDRMPKA